MKRTRLFMNHEYLLALVPVKLSLLLRISVFWRVLWGLPLTTGSFVTEGAEEGAQLYADKDFPFNLVYLLWWSYRRRSAAKVGVFSSLCRWLKLHANLLSSFDTN